VHAVLSAVNAAHGDTPAQGKCLADTVSAPDEQAALKAAVKTFAFDKVEVKRLLVRQCR
jgi:hypothetical protein